MTPDELTAAAALVTEHLAAEPPNVSAREAFAALREASGGRWDNVDPEEFVRELRGDDSTLTREPDASEVTGKALYEKWCELTGRSSRWDGTVFTGWQDGWDRLAELVAWRKILSE